MEEAANTKKCSKCGENKALSEFHASNQTKDGKKFDCKECRNKQNRERALKNKEINKKDKISKNTAKKCDCCGEEKQIELFYFRNDMGKHSNYCKKCKDGQNRKYAIENKEEIAKYQNEYCKEYRKDPEKKKIRNKREVEARKNNITRHLSDVLRTRIGNLLKTGSAVKDLGCSIEEFKLHLERQFYPNKETKEEMSWENYGKFGWHIDHIKPLASFNLENREEFLKAAHYTNLQPLWAKENLSKSDKTDWKK